jgi:hypothetical protein
MRRFGTLTLAFLLTAFVHVQAQSYVEAGGFIGFANYQGDLAHAPIEFGETKYSFGGFVKYPYSSKLHLKAHLYYGRISGDDLNASEVGTQNRNWRFTADLYEVAVGADFLPFGKTRFNEVGLFRPQINPFITIGVGSTFANKNLDYSQSGIPLANLRTTFPEPDDKDNFLVFPVGGGLRIDFTQWTTLSGEIGWRYTQSDYIEGVSVNGIAAGPDWYFFMGVTFSTYFGEQEDFGLR